MPEKKIKIGDAVRLSDEAIAFLNDIRWMKDISKTNFFLVEMERKTSVCIRHPDHTISSAFWVPRGFVYVDDFMTAAAKVLHGKQE